MKNIMVLAAAVAVGVSFADMTATNDTLQSTSDARAICQKEREEQLRMLQSIRDELRRSRKAREKVETARCAGQETGGDVMSLNFNVPLDQVMDAYAELAEKTLLIDAFLPRSYITLKSGKGRKFTKEECLETLGAALEMNGIHLEPCGEKVIRVFPSKVALQNGIPIIMSPKPLEEKGRIVSMMISFKNISVEEGCNSLQGFRTEVGLWCIFERTNSVLVTDVDRNINRMLEIAKSIDIMTEK